MSALGTFWFGAGVSGWNSVKDILNPALELHSIGWEVWAVLSTSFLVDGFVLNQVGFAVAELLVFIVQFY